jgi:pimeloyl-ACP methyl ester carboxylesterase
LSSSRRTHALTRPPLLLFLHAFPLDARMWDAHVAALERAGYETLAPTLPGHDPDDDLGSWAERILELVPCSFVPIGCSMGGYLIFELWRRACARIPAAAFVDTRAGADTPEVRAGRAETIRVLEEEGFDAFWAQQQPKLFAPATPADVVERARALAAAQPIPNLVATVRALAGRPDSSETASSIGVPALVLVGEEDALVPPAEAAELAGLLPSAKLVTVPGAGHLMPIERPDEVTEELFLFFSSAAPPAP